VQFDDNGVTGSFEIIRSEPPGVFDKAVRKAVNGRRYFVPKGWGETDGRRGIEFHAHFNWGECPGEGSIETTETSAFHVETLAICVVVEEGPIERLGQ
jgi:hypothetical protein